MKRDSVLFYRSFYAAIQGLPKDIQLEIYTAVMEYGLNGVLPDDLKPVAKGMFALMQPVIDNNNKRFENGKKGGRKSPVKSKPENPAPDYNLTFEQETDSMKDDAVWSAAILEDYSITSEEYSDHLRRFLKHCYDTRPGKPHNSLDDAKSHFRYWMDKAPSSTPQPQKEPKKEPKKQSGKRPAPTREQLQQKERDDRRQMYDKMKRESEPPAGLIRRMGYDPEKVTIAQALNPAWRKDNPPELPPAPDSPDQ